jgi:hypothetical protein
LALAISLVIPPAFWLCVIGGVMLVITVVAQSARTGEWMFLPWRENDISLSSAEATWGLVGGALAAVPLLVAVVRSLAAR